MPLDGPESRTILFRCSLLKLNILHRWGKPIFFLKADFVKSAFKVSTEQKKSEQKITTGTAQLRVIAEIDGVRPLWSSGHNPFFYFPLFSPSSTFWQSGREREKKRSVPRGWAAKCSLPHNCNKVQIIDCISCIRKGGKSGISTASSSVQHYQMHN